MSRARHALRHRAQRDLLDNALVPLGEIVSFMSQRHDRNASTGVEQWRTDRTIRALCMYSKVFYDGQLGLAKAEEDLAGGLHRFGGTRRRLAIQESWVVRLGLSHDRAEYWERLARIRELTIPGAGPPGMSSTEADAELVDTYRYLDAGTIDSDEVDLRVANIRQAFDISQADLRTWLTVHRGNVS